ncbi:hypothetical protein [Streptomyces sp. MST-110588]|uniref:hypothetical protein n=1 Tax=Streptomyces sp. MST-110588 TaxID=2833628 RepID=UPI001F5D22CD|nr:hypothetical protein [Streptomyces sp. MST-110588]UNO43584.1 hypothetical protein KGS77_34030 [Streptomyces sp. MST-110588]
MTSANACLGAAPIALPAPATELPAAALARPLGTDIIVTDTWQRATAGNRAAYAAEIGHRRLPQEDTE